VTCKSAWLHDACKGVSKFVSPLFNLIFIHASLEALLADTKLFGSKTTDNGFTSSYLTASDVSCSFVASLLVNSCVLNIKSATIL